MLTATEIRATAIARGQATKRVNAWTAVLCGGVPVVALGILFPTRLPQWVAGFGVGLLWASLFEYAYHRFLLHLPRLERSLGGGIWNTTRRWGRQLKLST